MRLVFPINRFDECHQHWLLFASNSLRILFRVVGETVKKGVFGARPLRWVAALACCSVDREAEIIIGLDSGPLRSDGASAASLHSYSATYQRQCLLTSNVGRRVVYRLVAGGAAREVSADESLCQLERARTNRGA